MQAKSRTAGCSTTCLSATPSSGLFLGLFLSPSVCICLAPFLARSMKSWLRVREMKRKQNAFWSSGLVLQLCQRVLLPKISAKKVSKLNIQTSNAQTINAQAQSMDKLTQQECIRICTAFLPSAFLISFSLFVFPIAGQYKDIWIQPTAFSVKVALIK